jgi:hypothetical protein
LTTESGEEKIERAGAMSHIVSRFPDYDIPSTIPLTLFLLTIVLFHIMAADEYISTRSYIRHAYTNFVCHKVSLRNLHRFWCDKEDKQHEKRVTSYLLLNISLHNQITAPNFYIHPLATISTLVQAAVTLPVTLPLTSHPVILFFKSVNQTAELNSP